MILPKQPASYNQDIEQRRSSIIERELAQAVKVRTILDALYLRSPNGTVYKLTLDNTGAVFVEAQ